MFFIAQYTYKVVDTKTHLDFHDSGHLSCGGGDGELPL